MKTKALTFIVLLLLVVFACEKDKEDAFPPGHVWKAGDYPSLTAPEGETDEVGIGEPVFIKSALHKGTFRPTINKIKAKNWFVKVYRQESSGCGCGYQWPFNNSVPIWSHEIPEKKYVFEFSWDCHLIGHKDSKLYLDGRDLWAQTTTPPPVLTLMQNGHWLESITRTYSKNWDDEKGNKYDVTMRFDLPALPDPYLCKSRTWVVEPGSDYDITETEGTYKITTINKTGVSTTNTSTFSSTLGLSASVPLYDIQLGINQTWTQTYEEKVTFYKEDVTIKEKNFTIPEGERWRFITIYGVERYYFTDSKGNYWKPTDFIETASLGNIDNKVRTFLMVVKYKEGSLKAYSSDLIDAATFDNMNENID